ncbi:hypothetical protein MMC10_010835 [Thelotrema lepadinum]|nr:hypothetical protein [Thelotrema lepadinum]
MDRYFQASSGNWYDTWDNDQPVPGPGYGNPNVPDPRSGAGGGGYSGGGGGYGGGYSGGGGAGDGYGRQGYQGDSNRRDYDGGRQHDRRSDPRYNDQSGYGRSGNGGGTSGRNDQRRRDYGRDDYSYGSSYDSSYGSGYSSDYDDRHAGRHAGRDKQPQWTHEGYGFFSQKPNKKVPKQTYRDPSIQGPRVEELSDDNNHNQHANPADTSKPTRESRKTASGGRHHQQPSKHSRDAEKSGALPNRYPDTGSGQPSGGRFQGTPYNEPKTSYPSKPARPHQSSTGQKSSFWQRNFSEPFKQGYADEMNKKGQQGGKSTRQRRSRR